MPSRKRTNEPGHVTTGNVLEDLGFSPEEIREIEIKHKLWVPIRAEIEAQRLTQTQLSKMLQIHQPDASLLLRGQIGRFSITRLLQFANRLQLAVTVTVAPRTVSEKTERTPRMPARRRQARRPIAKPPTTSRISRKLA